ncbi:MAG TPA: BON domain-containing protein [Castellaniella sp.]|nr:BON domain-containing protein [Castellaniella sp.]
MFVQRYAPPAFALAATLILAACAPYQPTVGEIDRNYPVTAQNAAAASYYRGTEMGVVTTSPDATINANVLAALSRIPSGQGTNVQVSTYNGIVTMRGVADTRAIAQSYVQTARQVPGVQRVDYDIQVLGH